MERKERNSPNGIKDLYIGGKMKVLKKVSFSVVKVLAVYVLLGFVLWLHGMEIVARTGASGKAKSSQRKLSKSISKEIEKGAQWSRKKIQKTMIKRSSNRIWQKLWKYV